MYAKPLNGNTQKLLLCTCLENHPTKRSETWFTGGATVLFVSLLPQTLKGKYKRDKEDINSIKRTKIRQKGTQF